MKRFVRWGYLGLALLVGAGILVIRNKLYTVRPKQIPNRTVYPVPDFQSNPAINFAVKKFRERGGTYIWGTNDCSVFVSDYLRKRQVQIGNRVTTEQLSQADFIPRGLKKVYAPTDGDVLNYRYISPKWNRPSGHCGVVFSQKSKLWVIHNSLYTGLTVQPLSDFLATAKELKTKGVRILRPTPARLASL